MTIAVDFDGTLCIDGQPNIALITQMRQHQCNGDSVVLFTSRVGKSLMEAIQFCARFGLVFNGVFGGKPIADVYIDDKALNPFATVVKSNG